MLATFYVEDDDVKYRFAPIRSFSSEIDYSVFDKSKFELINKSTDIPVELFQPFGMFHLRFGMWKKGYATGKCFVVDSYDRSIKPFGIDYESRWRRFSAWVPGLGFLCFLSSTMI